MLQDYTALNTMFRMTPQKQTTFISPKGKEKQIDYVLTKRRHLKHIKDAEANDMIHTGSDHRCVMANFQSQRLERTLIIKKENTTRTNVKEVHKLKKTSVSKCPSSKNIKKSSKNTAATKETEAPEKRKDSKSTS